MFIWWSLKETKQLKEWQLVEKGVHVHLISALVPALIENSLWSSIAEQNCLTSWVPRNAETLCVGSHAFGVFLLPSFQVYPDKIDCSPLPQNPNPETSPEKQLMGFQLDGHVLLWPSSSACLPASCFWQLLLPLKIFLCGLGAFCETWARDFPCCQHIAALPVTFCPYLLAFQQHNHTLKKFFVIISISLWYMIDYMCLMFIPACFNSSSSKTSVNCLKLPHLQLRCSWITHSIIQVVSDFCLSQKTLSCCLGTVNLSGVSCKVFTFTKLEGQVVMPLELQLYFFFSLKC